MWPSAPTQIGFSCSLGTGRGNQNPILCADGHNGSRTTSSLMPHKYRMSPSCALLDVDRIVCVRVSEEQQNVIQVFTEKVAFQAQRVSLYTFMHTYCVPIHTGKRCHMVPLGNGERNAIRTGRESGMDG